MLYQHLKKRIEALLNFLNNKQVNNSYKKYDTYKAALGDCNSKDGYEKEVLINTIIKKTENYSQNFKRDFVANKDTIWGINSILLALMNKKKIVVLDIGGAAGVHYINIRRLISEEIELDWNILETPKMVEKCKLITTNELHFFDNISVFKNKEIDIIFASGVFQCVEYPYDFIEEVCSLNAKFIFIGRISFRKPENVFFYIQESSLSSNGVGKLPDGIDDMSIEYPIAIINKKAFLNPILKKYELVMESEEKYIFDTRFNEEILSDHAMIFKCRNSKTS